MKTLENLDKNICLISRGCWVPCTFNLFIFHKRLQGIACILGQAEEKMGREEIQATTAEEKDRYKRVALNKVCLQDPGQALRISTSLNLCLYDIFLSGTATYRP